MNFYKKLRNKTTLTPLEVVNGMKEVSPKVNKNLTVRKYLECEKGLRKMKGERLNSFLEILKRQEENTAGRIIENMNLAEWFEDFRLNHFAKKMKEFNIPNQKTLAEKLGIAQSKVSETISGKRKASIDIMKLYKDFFEDDMNIITDNEVKSEPTPIRKRRTSLATEKETQKIIDEINCILQETKMTAKRLSEKIGIDSGTLSKLRSRKTKMGTEVYRKIVDFLSEYKREDITTEDVFEDTIEDTCENTIDDVTEVFEEPTNSEETTQEIPNNNMYIFALKNVCKRQQEIIENYETLIRIIKNLQK